MSATPFHLRETIQRRLRETTLTPEQVAEKVTAEVPSRALRRTLGTLMVAYVREINRDLRNSWHASRSTNGFPNSSRKASGGNLNSARSSKVAGFRAVGRAWLHSRVYVDGGSKLFGACEHDDLIYAAKHRRSLAAQNVHRAERYEWLANQLLEHNVTRVEELPDEVLDAFENWRRAA